MAEIQNLTPELIEKAKKAQNIEELRKLANDAKIEYSETQLQEFAKKLGISEDGLLDDQALANVSGGRSTINGVSTECVTIEDCEKLGLDPEKYKNSGSCTIGGKPGVNVAAADYDDAVAKYNTENPDAPWKNSSIF